MTEDLKLVLAGFGAVSIGFVKDQEWRTEIDKKWDEEHEKTETTV